MISRASNTKERSAKAAASLDFFKDVALTCTAELGRAGMPIRRFLALARGSVIELGRLAGEPVELRANGKLIARGEVVVVNDHYGLRITEICEPKDDAE